MVGGTGLTAVPLRVRQVKTKGSRRLSFKQFLAALAMVAEVKKLPLDTVVDQVLASTGPSSSGTRASYVKFHDDKVRHIPLGFRI